MRQCKVLHPEFKCFLCPLISERTKPLIAAKKYLLSPETEFFNRIGQNLLFPKIKTAANERTRISVKDSANA